MKLKIKLIVGFRRDQEHSVDADEAHKAYYLFTHPEARTIFNNGLAIKGDQIQEIVPDYVGTMGWNPTHTIGPDDWLQLNQNGVAKKVQTLLSAGKNIAQIGDEADFDIPLSELIEKKYPQLDKPTSGIRSGLNSLKNLLSTPTT